MNEADDRTCPKCRCGLRNKEPSTWTCLGCGGAWIERDGYADALAEAGGADALLVELGRGAADTAYDCPCCGSVKLEASVARGIVLDWCRYCGGIYFDPGELERLGPDRAEQPETAVVAAAQTSEAAGSMADWVVTDVMFSAFGAILDVITD